MEDSIFTKIIRGDIPSYKVYEDDIVYAMLDIDPLSDGHLLVIPKKQIDLLWDLDDETYQYTWKVSKQLAKVMQEFFNPKRVGVVVEGFGVPHAHVHLVPLYDDDVLQLHHGYPVDKDSLEEVAKKFSQSCQNLND